LGTLLQKVYDKFFIKVSDVDFYSKEDLVFEFFETALGYSYKTTPHDLGYTLNPDDTYDGTMNENLNTDEIELISLNMKKAYLEYLLKPSSRLKAVIGTKDFNRLPNKVEEYKVYSLMLEDLDNKIEAFRQEFYSYLN